MLDLTTEKGRFISAALALAAEAPWQDVTLSAIAQRAGSTLAAFKALFRSKQDLVQAFIGLVDDEVLARAPQQTADHSARDALFEVVMSRFDVLEPWKPGIRSIARAGLADPGLLPHVLASQRWMLEAAGIGSGGVEGTVRAVGLASVYAGVFRIWLDDEDPGLARTMAALDLRLRRGERTMRRTDDVIKGFGRIAGAVFGAADAVRSRMDENRSARSRTPPPGQPSNEA